MARQYAVVDHRAISPTSYHPAADAALDAARATAASALVDLGLARTVEEQCADGTLIFGEWGDLGPHGQPSDPVPLVWVDELGR